MNPALTAVAAALQILATREAALNTPQMVVNALAQMEQAEWDRIATDIASGDLDAEARDDSP